MMISVITGDIINSKKVNPESWLSRLKSEMEKIGPTPKYYDIYRGDSFQLLVEDPLNSLATAIKIKASIRSVANLDVRMAIGIGKRTFKADRISESNGPAFIFSGEKFEVLKKQKQNLAILTEWPDFDREINLMLKLGLIAMDHWPVKAAQTICLMLDYPEISQDVLGSMLGIKQNAVSGRLTRSYFQEIRELLDLFRFKLQSINDHIN